MIEECIISNPVDVARLRRTVRTRHPTDSSNMVSA